MIRFPGIGPINAFEKGTGFIDLKNHLREKIREQLGEGVQSSITLGAFRSIRIFLLGEVRKQGAYTVSAYFYYHQCLAELRRHQRVWKSAKNSTKEGWENHYNIGPL